MANQKILTYLRLGLKKGYSLDSLKKASYKKVKIKKGFEEEVFFF